MAALTAVLSIGHAHPNRGGLRSAAEVRLTEGGRPALVFRAKCPVSRAKAPATRPPIVIPTLENTLEDAMLLIAYVLRLNHQIEAAFDQVMDQRGAGGESRHLEMYECFTVKDRDHLYRCLRDEPQRAWPKIGLHIYRGSLLLRQASRMAYLPYEYEVLLPAFGRSWSAWSGSHDDWDDRSGIYDSSNSEMA